ncbi:MAG TPA: ThuA domain-containing protein, partial [Pirellulales bacterium]|nr:ThuA domain-containing protein [Pirellulales bacterium]
PRAASRIYGEWRIQVRPDRGADYNRLIERQGLPLFREAGGRMVGWWTMVAGDLYEHVTIWEYDGLDAYQRFLEKLGKDKGFARFAAQRDPLLAGEQSRFLQLAAGAEPPHLPETARFVIHERHRVPLAKRQEYLAFFTGDGLAMLKRHGFRPVGPWTVAVGTWSEFTWLFTFDSLAERDRLIADFSGHDDGGAYGDKLSGLVDEVTTQLLTPAPFATGGGAARDDVPKEARSVLPHLEQIAPGVFVAGFADRFGSANCGWLATTVECLLVDLPRGVPVDDFLGAIAKTTVKPVRRLVLTNWQPGDEAIVASLIEAGIKKIATSPMIGKLLAETGKVKAEQIEVFSARAPLGETTAIEFLPLDGVAGATGGAVYLPDMRTLFAGPVVIHGPRVPLPGSDTAQWLSTLDELDQLDAQEVVPGRGSWGGPERIARLRSFLTELRRQVGYTISLGRPALPQAAEFFRLPAREAEVRLPAGEMVWMPYDTPTADDLLHVYQELTVPLAPFNGRPPRADDPRPHALVLIGDGPHEPGHVEAGLRPAFAATGVVPHFAVDVRALTAENLARVPLLVILRDGMQRPNSDPGSHYKWMTPEQERAVVEFVERGGGFVNLHNSMGLYPDGGPYLKLVGGRYIGHGPLERFRVEVVDRNHPITRGVEDFSVADEQHTPPYDNDRVHLLLKNRSDDGREAAAGWCYEPGRGRLVHLANGHTREALAHPMYQRLLAGAIRWCLRSEESDR